MTEGTKQSGELRRRAVRGKIVEGDVFPFWDHQNMGGCLRADVVEGEDVLVLVNLFARDFAT
jgi:hypothetical protein